jgi:hypothetical protein
VGRYLDGLIPHAGTKVLGVHRLPAAPGAGRFVAAMVLLANADHDQLRRDVDRCAGRGWYA